MSTATLIIPTYIANRYGERPAGLERLNLETKLEDILLRIEILESEQIRSIKSISHDILVERGTHIGQAQKWDHIGQGINEAAIVTMKEHRSWLETDFILSIDTTCSKGIGGAEAWLEMHPTFEEQAAMMVTLPPWALYSPNDVSEYGEILFVADRSGSMEDKMKNLKSAMHFFLKGIPVGRIFNIWCFGSHYQPLWAQSQVYGRWSLRQALKFVDEDFDSNMGGTELLPALEAIIAARDPSLPCDVVILTDGQVWRLDDTLSFVRRAHESSEGAIRFFSLGLGNHVSHALVEGIAKQGGGCSEIIPRADKEGWEERVVAILKAALTRHVHTLSLDLGDLKGTSSPENLESLNPFDAHRILLLLDEGTIPENDRATLTLVSDGMCIPIDVAITRIGKPGTLIHTLSARAMLDDLERTICTNAFYQPGGWSNTREEDLSRLAEDLACKYSLPSKWTSLFLSLESSESSRRQTINEVVISRSEDTFLRSRGRQSNPLIQLDILQGGWPGPRPSLIRGRPKFSGGMGFRVIRTDPVGAKKAKKKRPVLVSKMTSSTGRAEIKSSPSSKSRYTNKASARKKVISLILSHQAFDGSMTSGVLKELPKGADIALQSLKEWLHEKIHRDGVAIDLVANTALTIAFLERDYQDIKALWIMIRKKGIAYIRLQVCRHSLGDELMEYSRESLKHRKSSNHGKNLKQRTSQKQETSPEQGKSPERRTSPKQERSLKKGKSPKRRKGPTWVERKANALVSLYRSIKGE